ncbi:hypothetical protein HTZ84_21665 [Haloterrigena sp. SYSU A558-1]|uniref:DUF8106 domain-containing protein n=1 Tax=Haloterrigena gelatinilytica TaxID=2741724 RepID=A0A8J8GRD6_9EURY|nr:hypothetical protein [Haloterrigena gelatinilytica]NUB93948.1 hypothetical protein [Haloterrigena gelatinilytica]NUC74875.1 hypothetical protein [Haloterrigena gelatinilytica]
MTRPATTDENPSVPRKSTLFCWECDHANPVDGDWVRRTRDRHVEYVCPVCETTLTKRPLPDDATADRSIARPTATWQRTVRTTIQIWRATIDVGLTGVAAVSVPSSDRLRR